MQKPIKIALMGGTFDPIHYGHLMAAEAARAKLNADSVIFLPSGCPPHKDNLLVTGSEHRYLMCALATASNPAFTVSKMEIERPGATYTVDTIRELRKTVPDDTEIFFITGADALKEIFSWKEAAVLVTLCNFVSVTRPGYAADDFDAEISPRITRLDAPALDISSSDIRARIRRGAPVKYLLPDAVLNYIEKNGLYAASDDLVEKINNYLKKELTTKRYIHTLGVTDAAKKLARRYGENVEKAKLAALLHDCAKDFTAERTLEYLSRYDIALDEVTKTQVGLTHPFIAAEIARDEFGVVDNEILEAIRYHTIGRENMSKLEKIIYIADCIDESRDYYEGLELIREAAYTDLDKAMIVGFEAAINYTVNKGRPVHPLSRTALKYISANIKKI